MKKLWLVAAMAIGVAGMLTPASAAVVVRGIPPHGVHGIIIRHCWHHRCCRYRRCGPHGIIIGRPVIGTRPIHPIGVTTHGIGPAGPGRVGPVNGIPVEQRAQH